MALSRLTRRRIDRTTRALNGAVDRGAGDTEQLRKLKGGTATGTPESDEVGFLIWS